MVKFAADLMTTSMAWRLRRSPHADAGQRRALAMLLSRLARTDRGRKLGIEPGMRYERFRDRVPLSTPESLAPDVERMMRGEPDVLWPGRCALFATSAGTTDGRPRHLPVTDELTAHFRRAGRDALLYYTARVGHTSVLSGRHLFLGGSTRLVSADESEPATALTGNLSGIAARLLPQWAREQLFEPDFAIARLSDWNLRLQAIIARARHRDITLVAGAPRWILNFCAALRAETGNDDGPAATLQSIWPNLECVVHGGASIEPYIDELRTVVGPNASFHEIYSAPEGFIAAQDGDAGQGLRLMAAAGLYFEFLPMTSFAEENLAQIGPQAVPLEGVQPGVDYALLVTTPAGLCRHVVGDVVRFISTDVPRLVYVGRTRLRLNAAGEQVSERELTHALTAVCRRHGWTMTDFHVAPLIAGMLTGQRRRAHEWWIELKVPTIETPTANVISPELDAALTQANNGYADRRLARILQPPVVRLVMPGVFEQWMRTTGRWDGLQKMPRCRSDRLIADQLVELSRFYAGSRPPYFVRQA